MNQFSVRRRIFAVATLSTATLLLACEDKRVKQLDTGITRDSAVSVIAKDLPPGSGPDSFPNVFARERFLIGGKNYEVLYFTPENQKARMANGVRLDTMSFKGLTPIVFVENKLAGRGWDYWDSVSNANKIPVKKR